MTKEISVQQAAALVDANAVVLLDVREPDEWHFVRVPGAVHVPMRQLGAHLDSLRTDVPIACICHVGGRSAVVADALAHHGYDAANVVGGMHAWEAAGLPVERG